MNFSLLHEGILDASLLGEYFVKPLLKQKIGAAALAAEGLTDPNVTILIRSRNNVEQLEGLFDDISQQNFNGEVETVLVDTESTDGTIDLAKRFGAEVVSIAQNDFSYPAALNKGFEAASHDWVFSLVDHSLLSSTEVLRTATRTQQTEGDVAGISGVVLPNTNATWIERAGMDIGAIARFLKQSPYIIDKLGTGDLGANVSAYHRDAWRELGGFDEAYGAGGEDAAFARIAQKNGYKVIADPVISVHHSHGVGLIDSLRQLRYWGKIFKEPLPFSREELEKFRSDLK